MPLKVDDNVRAVAKFAQSGDVRGEAVTDVETGAVICNRYLGIPYALPPTGPRRWQRPQPLPSDFKYSTKTYNQFQAQCPQPFYKVEHFAPPPTKPETSEDCLYLNVWQPAGEAPPAGWLVWFQIHGGWLQIGNANQDPLKDPSHAIAPTEQGGAGLQCVIVFATYRLNVFGFFSSKALEGESGQANFGFWDQRMALEWVHKHAAAFGANPHNITVSGLSAGSQSTHAQLLYEYSRSQQDPSYVPLIRRVLLRSGTALLPSKTFSDTRSQLDELCIKLNIPEREEAQQLQALRAVSEAALVEAIEQMEMHTFRSVDDGGPAAGGFVSPSWRHDLRSGDVSRWCKKHNITWIIGEAANEDQLYRLVNPPGPLPSYHESFKSQVDNYYPPAVVAALMPFYPQPDLSSTDASEWADVFGSLTSDAQVFTAERLLVRYLVRPDEGGLAPQDVLRYRLERRAAFYDNLVPGHLGVFHGADEPLWLFMKDVMLTASDKAEAQKDMAAFKDWMAPFAAWLRGAEQGEIAAKWLHGQQGHSSTMRIMRHSGIIEVAEDPIATAKETKVTALERAIFS